MRAVRIGVGRIAAREQNRERLASLGTMAAGLAHELNNPAAAARRAAADLAEALDVLASTIGLFVESGIERDQAEELVAMQREAIERALEQRSRCRRSTPPTPRTSCSSRSSASASPSRGGSTEPLAAAGVDAAWLDRLAEVAGPATSAAVAWIAASLTARGLAAEIAESTDRMGKLVKAIKAYAFMDRGELVETDIHEGLETTLVVLGHKLKHTSIEVRRDYDRSLPKLTLRGSELNQVWTNLLANAIEALGDSGTIEIVDRARRRLRASRHHRRRARDSRRDRRSRVRPVLHDQGRRRGHRPRARHGAADRHRAARRLDRVRLRARADRVSRLATAQCHQGARRCSATCISRLDHVPPMLAQVPQVLVDPEDRHAAVVRRPL